MRIPTILVTMAALCAPAAAFALEVNYAAAHYNTDMENLVAGQHGTITYSHPDYLQMALWGQLPAKTRLIFSYSFLAPIAEGSSNQLQASYNYTRRGEDFYGGATSDRFIPFNSALDGDEAHGYTNGSATLPLVLATSNLALGETHFEWSVSNNSEGRAHFYNELLMGYSDGINLLTYQVLATPLPAALPMFSALLAAWFGLQRWRLRRRPA